MSVQDVAEEPVGVRKALGAGTLPHAHHPVLLWVKHAALLAHGLGVGDSGAEEAVPLQAPVEAGPVVVPVPGVRQAPGDEGVELPGRGVAGLASCNRILRYSQATGDSDLCKGASRGGEGGALMAA